MNNEENTDIQKKHRIPKYVQIIIGILIGMLLGFIWHKVVGCSSGACPIASNYLYSLGIGGLLGLVVTLIK